MLGLSAVAISGACASAAAMLPLSPAVTGQANAGSEGIVQIKHKKKWKKNWNNDNYDYDWQYRRHRHRDRDGLYLSLPLIIGGAYAANRYYDDDYYDEDDYDYDVYDGGGLSSRHIRYCLNRYQSYNPRNNTWVAYSGQVKKCYSPYM